MSFILNIQFEARNGSWVIDELIKGGAELIQHQYFGGWLSPSGDCDCNDNECQECYGTMQIHNAPALKIPSGRVITFSTGDKTLRTLSALYYTLEEKEWFLKCHEG